MITPYASVSGKAMVDARRRGVASTIVCTLTAAAIRGQQPTDCQAAESWPGDIGVSKSIVILLMPAKTNLNYATFLNELLNTLTADLPYASLRVFVCSPNTANCDVLGLHSQGVRKILRFAEFVHVVLNSMFLWALLFKTSPTSEPLAG